MREEENNNKFSHESKKRVFMRKKWLFPAIYIASAALILVGVLVFTGGSGDESSPDDFAVGDQPNSEDGISSYSDGEEAVPVTQAQENIQMPVLDENEVFIQKQYYDDNAPEEEQEAALVFYDNTYYPSTGIDIAMESGDSFDVVAALSGTVTKAEKDPLLGNVVEVEHENGVMTVYQGLENVQVETGATVEQGQVIASAGQSAYNQDAGVHVHFEVRKDGNAVNPIDYFNKPISSVGEEQEKEEASQEGETEEGNQEDETEQDTEENSETGAEDEGEGDGEGENSTDANTPDASISMSRA